MKSSLTLAMLLFLIVSSAGAQTVAMPFSGLDCNNNPVDLFADLDSGKAVVLFYYMPNCGSCPPPASKIQSMANRINASYPGMVKGYAFPFQNVTTCTYSASWVTTNMLPFYTPMDSGATQVAYYGGFGMPTVVLVGGSDHRVMFSTLNFVTSDTTIMRDSILNMLGVTSRTPDAGASALQLFPIPARDRITLRTGMEFSGEMNLEVCDLSGKTMLNMQVMNNDEVSIPVTALAEGTYICRISCNGNRVSRRFVVRH